jgi:hypothetical protein
MSVVGSHNCHLVRIFWQNGRINYFDRVNLPEVLQVVLPKYGDLSNCMQQPTNQLFYMRGLFTKSWN